MDTMAEFAMGEANRGNPLMVFDWHRAARLIKERNPTTVRAGLSGDWGYTGGTIWTGGKPVVSEDGLPYLASTWATPEIEIDDEIMNCMKMCHEPPEADEWDAHTSWPASALKILGLESPEETADG